jgi:hypothetical protein
MNTHFIVNDYALIWNLLFQASISETIYKLKQKLWDTYKNEYNKTYKDKNLISKDYKNFIPSDDTIYNIVLDNKDYNDIKKQTEKYRLEIMSLWDKNKKETAYLMKNIIRLNISEYTVFIVNKELNVIENTSNDTIVVGKKIDEKHPEDILVDINMAITSSHIKDYDEESKIFKDAILELAIKNEYKTRLTKEGCYNEGVQSLKEIKRFLYPYWLMYLGVSKDEFLSYMMRDEMVFDADKYAYEKELKKMNIEEFIDFCIRNKRYIIREQREISNEEII